MKKSRQISVLLAAILITTMWGCRRNGCENNSENGGELSKCEMAHRWKHHNSYIVTVRGLKAKIWFQFPKPPLIETHHYVCHTSNNNKQHMPEMWYWVETRSSVLYVFDFNEGRKTGSWRLIEDGGTKTKILDFCNAAFDVAFKRIMAEKSILEKQAVESVSPIPTKKAGKRTWERSNRKWN